MKLKLVMIFIGVVLILLMFGLEIVQGDDIGYPVPIEPINTEVGYVPPPTQAPLPTITKNPLFRNTPTPVVIYPTQDYSGYPVNTPIPTYNPYPEPVASSPEIELSSITYKFEPIAPQYVNGRNLWQEILFQFAKLLELMK